MQSCYCFLQSTVALRGHLRLDGNVFHLNRMALVLPTLHFFFLQGSHEPAGLLSDIVVLNYQLQTTVESRAGGARLARTFRGKKSALVVAQRWEVD